MLNTYSTARIDITTKIQQTIRKVKQEYLRGLWVYSTLVHDM